MLELRFIRENIDLVRAKCLHRGMKTDLTEKFTAIDAKRLAMLAEVEQLKNRLEAESAYLQEEIKVDHAYETIIGK